MPQTLSTSSLRDGRRQALPLRVGIVGCGAIGEHGYLPALEKTGSASARVLIDRNLERARALAERWQVPRAGAGIDEAIGEIDAAVVATPNHLHAPVACALLKRGIPVLVEKPMALNVAECDEMLAAAKEGGASLGVGFVCRFSRAARMTKTLLQSGALGKVRSLRAENGCVFGWPVTSDFLFRRQTAGGGVLMDLGPHVLDLLVWWLGPVAEIDEHFDDSFGGVEADSITRLTMKNGARGTVRLSRTCRMNQGILLECENGSLYVHLDRPALRLRFKDSALQLESEVLEAARGSCRSEPLADLFAKQIDDWARAVAEGRNPSADGVAGREIVSVIERCYAQRQQLRLPWL